MGVTGLLAHFCLTSALAEADATVVMPLELLRLPLVALAGFLLYAESFELEILLGALIIFSGDYISLWYETRRGPPPDPPAAPTDTATPAVPRKRPRPGHGRANILFALGATTGHTRHII